VNRSLGGDQREKGQEKTRALAWVFEFQGESRTPVATTLISTESGEGLGKAKEGTILPRGKPAGSSVYDFGRKSGPGPLANRQVRKRKW